jgi:hypothetical protein
MDDPLLTEAHMKMSKLLHSINQKLPEDYEDYEISWFLWFVAWVSYKVGWIKGYFRKEKP